MNLTIIGIIFISLYLGLDSYLEDKKKQKTPIQKILDDNDYKIKGQWER